jgi:ectoine hydroxylase-related dioxygenase (phytanoyl-CoA dioxygenase family)
MVASSGAPTFSADDPQVVAHFDAHGWVIVRSSDADTLAAIRDWVADVSSWPDDVNVLHYRERTTSGPKLCRTEHFVPFHDGLRALLTSGPMLDVASALLREPAVLYKEKINYKLAGGAGYSPHQDAPAYPFIDQHVSCMIAVDDADEHNGCLEVASGMHHELLPVDEVGCIPQDVVATLEWMPVPLRAGDTLWFHSRTPHRSGANHSANDRRAIYPTYNALSEGDLRDAYYAEKLARMAAARVGDHVQVSLIGDFQGQPV